MSTSVPNSANRRERRIAARKAEIIVAAARLFAEKGFHRTTTRDIAEAADVSEGTIYNYFENKDDLLMGIMSHLVESQQFAAHLSDGIPDDSRQFLETTLRLRKQFIDQNGVMMKSVLSEILVNPELSQRFYQDFTLPLIDILEGHLQQGGELGKLRGLEVSLAARILVGLMTGLYVLHVLGDPLVNDQWELLTEHVASLLFEGVTPRKESPNSGQ